ncbi:MAG: hypothetical protein K0R25_519 [Rickettsiaceae bacterium]|jgi:hypothetical protein|nr:hypothetical protein [Rickettsiaceae bacterium]
MPIKGRNIKLNQKMRPARNALKTFVNPALSRALNSFRPGSANIYTRSLSEELSEETFFHYHSLEGTFSESDIKRFNFLKGQDSHPLKLSESEVFQVSKPDIKLSSGRRFGSIMIASSGAPVVAKFAPCGVKPSNNVSPQDLLKDSVTLIGDKGAGTLIVEEHRPFSLYTPAKEDVKKVFAFSFSPLERVYEHKENINRYSINTICSLTPSQAKKLSRSLQIRISTDPNSEHFFEERTAVVYKPTIHNKSSGTLMNFSSGTTQEETTNMHYHPGERSLIIVTTDKPAGVTLNFCGIAEDPDRRKDCEANIEFIKNSIVVLNFPPYTHHKFHGRFNCLSVHPREGENFIQAIKSGILSQGFLESATVFSKRSEAFTNEGTGEWKLSTPVDFDNQAQKSL